MINIIAKKQEDQYMLVNYPACVLNCVVVKTLDFSTKKVKVLPFDF